MDEILVVILAGGAGDRLSVLSAERAKPAVPFGGKFRIIDFTLSNCVNSGLYYVAVLTQYRPRSLGEHIGIGKPWDLDRRKGGIELLQPHIDAVGGFWYRGTADAVYHNIRFIASRGLPYTLILSGDHIYKMNYKSLFQHFIDRGADLVVSAIEVDQSEISRFGIIVPDEKGRVVEFKEKPKQAETRLASMGVYIFKTDVLMKVVSECVESGGYDFGKDVIPYMLEKGYSVYVYNFKGYWRDVGTVYSLWRANMDLIEEPPRFNLNDSLWPVYTNSFGLPPVKLGVEARIERCVMGGGAIIEGLVRRSVIHQGAIVHKGAQVEDSVIMDGTIVGPKAIVKKTIVDKKTVIGEGARVGLSDEQIDNEEIQHLLGEGLTLIGKNVRVTPGAVVGINCLIYPGTGEEVIGNFVRSGSTIRPQRLKVSR
ncbi:MAG TPA: glucose-1-phosphate adenylyltransferase [Firmicutes bacterium]|nr:glucose-1-phosphate adenylyltransferase [Bacillota bacterium]